jgi:hypothetical protein
MLGDIMKQKIDALSHNTSKLEVSLNLYEEIKSAKVSSHDEYIINITKLKFLEKEILDSCEKMLEITRKKEINTKSHI